MSINLSETNTKTSHRIYPWVVISISAFFLFYKYVLQVSPSIMTHDLMRAFQINAAGLGNLAACYFYTFLIMQIPVGVLLDRYSPRKLTALAIGLCGIGALGFALAPNLMTAMFARALIGFGAAFATVSYLKLATIWFPPERFSLIAGFLATAAMLGAVGGEAPLSIVVSHLGWQHTLLACALIGIAFAILFWLLVRDENPIGYVTARTPIMEKTQLWDGLIAVLRNPQNWLLSVYSGLAFAPTDVFAGLWGVPFLTHYYSISRTSAAAAVSFAFVGLAVGAPIIGWFSDRIAKRRVLMIIGTSLSFICLTAAIYLPPQSFTVLALLLFFFGVGTSSFMLGFVVGKEINPLFLAATVVAVINTSDALWGAISEPLIGKFLDLGWTGQIQDQVRQFSINDYHHALIILPGYLLIAFMLLFFIREKQT